MKLEIKNLETITKALNNQPSSDWLKKWRQQGLESFYREGIPTTKNEEWKYTNLSKLTRCSYILAEATQPVNLEMFNNYHGKDINIIFVNGILCDKLSNFDSITDEVLISPLQEALTRNEVSFEELGIKFESTQESAFLALNDALTQQGVFIKIKANTVSSKLIHVIHVAVSTAEPILSVPKTIIFLDPSSEAQILESHLTMDDTLSYFSNSVTDVFIKENATLYYGKAQRESVEAFHVGTTRVWQERDSHFDGFSLMTGGALVRNDVDVILDGEGASTVLNGLYSIRSQQHVDNHTSIDHRVPHCDSHQLYKGILNGSARAVFNGKILVRSEAQQTNSYQLNKNLLLGKDCRVDTKPQLEIFADDVKCSHGATIGQLDEDELFYLQTRCIRKQKAIRMLARGFVDDVLNKIVSQKIRNKLQCQIPH